MKVQELSLHLTTACNLRCSYCYGKRQRNEYLSYKKANDAIEAFIKVGKEIRFNIMTNGIMLSGPVARPISNFNAFVCFSLDGVRFALDRYRLLKNGKGSHRSSAAALNYLLKFLGPERFFSSNNIASGNRPFIISGSKRDCRHGCKVCPVRP